MCPDPGSISDIPGVTPSPFDPTPPIWEPWPPLARLAAIGMGDYLGSLMRQVDQLFTADRAPAEVAKEQIASAAAGGRLSAGDAQRLTSYLSLGQGTDDASASSTSASDLLREAMDDPTSTPLALAILSIAAHKQEAAAGVDFPHHDPLAEELLQAYIVAVAVITGSAGLLIAEHVYEHYRITYIP